MMIQTRRRALMLSLSAAPLLAAGCLETAVAAATGTARPPAPPELPNAGVADLRGWAMNTSSRMPMDKAGRTAFMTRKLFTAYTHPAFPKDVLDQAVKEVLDSFGAQAQHLLDRPTSGGVGYGVFFDETYKQAWSGGTSIMVDLVCPHAPGGNVDTWLFMTASNRASLGAEAFVSYYGQNDARFLVFDWARASSDPWQVDIPLPQLDAYLQPSAGAGNAVQTLSVWNTTYSLGGRFYRNEALLYNHRRQGWDLVYQHDYAADEVRQKSGWIGSWGPIIETFQPLYSGTNPMGAKNTLLTESDSDGRWNGWSLLKPSESYVRNDDAGFNLRYAAPNFAFIAIS